MMARAGALLARSVDGLMQVMASRSALKNEFRLEQTMIQSQDNNPLKFSPSAVEALRLLLSQDRPGFKDGPEALSEAYDDLAAHQLAVLAGMQSALTALLRRFDPKRLEQRLGEDRSVASMFTGKKARYWDAFTQLYGDISEEISEDFQAVFGQAFAKAYEEQVRNQRCRASKSATALVAPGGKQ